MKILLAGPGTGKTTNIKSIVTEHGDGSRFLVLSFTNATVRDLQENLREQNITADNCMTLHKFAVKYNHDKSRHVLLRKEVDELKIISKGTEIEFDSLCDFLACTTFDQMILRFVGFALSNPQYLQDKLSQYDSLIIDEYQDFNPTEQSLIDILIDSIETSYVLGDDDQCIYDFKDASSDKIISFHQDPENEIIEHQHVCYRCPDKIVEHATNLIRNNQKRVPKKWEKSGKSGSLVYSQLSTLQDVAHAICNEIERIEPSESILVLTPVEFAIHPLVELLNTKQIAFVNLFTPKIADSTLIKAWEIRSIFGSYQYLNLILLGYSKLTNRRKFYEMIKNHFDRGQNYTELFNLLKSKLPDALKEKSSDLESLLANECYVEIRDRYLAAEGSSVDEKLENMLRAVDEEEEANTRIMSIHKSKGLGADHVFIVGLNEGIIPNSKRGNDSIESQRRLFFVGMTRAKKQLFLYSNVCIEGKHVNTVNKDEFRFNFRAKTWQGRASSFISELNL